MIDRDLPDWHEQAACKRMDPALFFPRAGESIRLIRLAKETCRGCPVQKPCLDWAVTTIEPFGIWGGVTERERRQLRRRVAS
jgi:WhiB family redox-sensing transcriptional regulator